MGQAISCSSGPAGPGLVRRLKRPEGGQGSRRGSGTGAGAAVANSEKADGGSEGRKGLPAQLEGPAGSGKRPRGPECPSRDRRKGDPPSQKGDEIGVPSAPPLRRRRRRQSWPGA